ncbi:piggyBac transposable element-derived protein 4 [Trichonephila clavipes]|nr:piggyBac transposable element-derived protein 4 [Trichonephila clavipes]
MTSDSESDFSFESDSDINFSDCSFSSDESDHDSINLQSVRQWCKIDLKNIPPSPVPFHGNLGITVNIANNASILNYFELFFDDQILRMIVQETIGYVEQYIHQTVCKEISLWKKWTETNVEELRLFFAVLLLQGVIKKPEQEHYWSKHQTLSTPIFAKWQDKKSVCLMSTIHDASSYLVTCKSKKIVMKPVFVCDYNNTMGGVDLCDQEMSYYPTLRKQQGKYYIKIFRQFLDQLLWNAYVLYKKQNSTHNIKLLEFRLRMVEESIQKYSDRDNCSGPGRQSSTPNPLPPNPIKRQSQRQLLFAVQEKMPMGKKIRKETRIWCKD